MGAADRILHEYRVSKRRFDAAIAAIELLSAEQRMQLVATLLDRFERTPNANGTTTPSELVPRRPKRKKTDIAEALVHERPGISSAEVGAVIAQNRSAADCTLRSIEKRRGTVQRRDGRWYPVNNGGSAPTN